LILFPETPEPIETRGIAEKDGFRIVAASVIGPAHVAAGARREDAFAIRLVGGWALAVVCDGAGSASRAAAGATAFSASVLCELETVAAEAAALSTKTFEKAVVDGVEACRAAILGRGGVLRDHHATLVAIAASRDRTFVAHVGDGLAGVAPAGEWPRATLSKPRNGEFANETFFVTEADWRANLRCLEAPALGREGAAVALTDGAMPFVIGPFQAGLEPEFMGPVSRFLRSGDAQTAAAALAGTLDSRDARRIASDDKTLVWIGRDAG
jgi:hypothetical protein